QGRDDDGRQRAEVLMAAQLGDEVARVGERVARLGIPAHMTRRVADADAEPETAARYFVEERRAVREVPHAARIDRRDRGAERDPLGGERERVAGRYVAEQAGHVDPGEAAPLEFAGELQGCAAAAGYRDQTHGRQLRLGHRDTDRSSAAVRAP